METERKKESRKKEKRKQETRESVKMGGKERKENSKE
jgi:hypothetical protein